MFPLWVEILPQESPRTSGERETIKVHLHFGAGIESPVNIPSVSKISRTGELLGFGFKTCNLNGW